MKKSLSTLILFSIVVMSILPIMTPVYADEGLITDPDQVVGFIERLGDWFFLILMAVAGVLIILAAWTFLTAGGNPDNITKARQMLIYALVGVAVGVLAKGLPYLIKNILEENV